ncbi:hypothetical protein SAMN05421676_102455 [Salinibacillus kushneri]|uniref:Uncharacterized protein n=1 Tax=Salinibacillus kushneri TaxID=237682 RepID=A0A1I0BF75_9BACI|nr:hypothetical protein [Salinibacillus kushneri]SET05532.1 hypothetical protein SAMN05421676_102455 [Salinibacillus kushneri]
MKNKFIPIISFIILITVITGCRSEVKKKIEEGNYEGIWTTSDEESQDIRKKLKSQNIHYLFEKKNNKSYLYVEPENFDQLIHIMGWDSTTRIVLVAGKRVIDGNHQLLIANNVLNQEKVKNLNFDQALSFSKEHGGGTLFTVSKDTYENVRPGSKIEVTYNRRKPNEDYETYLFTAKSVEIKVK